MRNLRKILAEEGLVARGPIELTDPSQVSDKRKVSRADLKDFRYQGKPIWSGTKYVFQDKADRELDEEDFQDIDYGEVKISGEGRQNTGEIVKKVN